MPKYLLDRKNAQNGGGEKMKICLPGRRKVPEQVKEEVPDFTENKTSGDTFKKL